MVFRCSQSQSYRHTQASWVSTDASAPCGDSEEEWKKRPLGIPTMKDRAMQTLYLMALDPVAETTGDIHSYGFRKHRSCQDAITQCHILLCKDDKSPQWILEGDIKGCFDHISHDWLLNNIPMDKEMLRNG